MTNNEGVVELHKVIKTMNVDGINYDKGLGTFDIGTVDDRYYLSTITINHLLNPSEYLVSANLLEHEGEVENIYKEKVKVYTRFKPGSYLVAYVNNTPVVLCQLVRGEKAIG